MSADLNVTMPLDLLDSLDEPTFPIVLVDSLTGAQTPGANAHAQAVILSANDGAAFISGGRMIRTMPPVPPPRRTR